MGLDMPLPALLSTGVRVARNVDRYSIGEGALRDLAPLVATYRGRAAARGTADTVVFLVDEFFTGRPEVLDRLGAASGDPVEFVHTAKEPTTDGIDALMARLRPDGAWAPAAVVGLGGGVTMDTAKAVANLSTNSGRAADYQGWDLLRVPAAPKIGVPTVSGTGAEATRTCVLTNPQNGLKLGMNSDYTVFDHVILDPALTATVPRDQYFWSGMDAYIHCMESRAGMYRNAIGDAFARETLSLCREVFRSDDMMAPEQRERLMVASYLGGCAIATSYVGVVHPFSAGLGVVLGLHHCVANCIVMRAMRPFYPAEHDEFWAMAEAQRVTIPSGVCRDCSESQFRALYDATVVHERPLTNALGEDFRRRLTFDEVVKVFQSM